MILKELLYIIQYIFFIIVEEIINNDKNIIIKRYNIIIYNYVYVVL